MGAGPLTLMDDPAADPIRLEFSEGIALLTLARPAVLNAIDVGLAHALGEAVTRVAASTEVRALLLKGEGRAFCAGGDVSRFDGIKPFEEVANRTMALFHPAILALANLPIPTVAAVHGTAAGAGIGLMLACDFVIAAPQTRFTLAYPKIGATIDGGASWFLPRLVGTRKAKELAMLSDIFDGAQAERLGLVTRLVSPDTLEDEAVRFARTLAAGPTQAFGAIKHLVDNALSRSLEAQLDAERDAFVEIARTPDFAEGLSAFREKRSPLFNERR